MTEGVKISRIDLVICERLLNYCFTLLYYTKIHDYTKIHEKC